MFICAASIAFGGCGLWSMHYTGIMATKVRFPSDLETLDLKNCTTCIDVDGSVTHTYEGLYWILSLVVAILSTWMGLVIASRDGYFKEVEDQTRKEMLVSGIKLAFFDRDLFFFFVLVQPVKGSQTRNGHVDPEQTGCGTTNQGMCTPI